MILAILAATPAHTRTAASTSVAPFEIALVAAAVLCAWGLVSGGGAS
jgi:hypothetical protein